MIPKFETDLAPLFWGVEYSERSYSVHGHIAALLWVVADCYPANNGEPFRFRIGSVKSAQLFQLSAENFFRLRYESVPLQWHVNGTDVGTKVKPNRIKNGWNKRFRIGSEISAELCRRDTICSEFRQNCADLFGFSAELCRFIRIFGIIVPIYSDFRQNCADFETILCQIVPNVRLFSLILCTIVPSLCRSDTICSEFRHNCAEFETVFMHNCAEFETVFMHNCAEFETVFMHNCAEFETVFMHNCADLFGISAELCRLWDCFHAQLCRYVQNFGRIVPILRLFYVKLCRLWDYFSAELCRRCAEFQTIFALIKLYQICVDLCYFRSTIANPRIWTYCS